MGSSSNIQNYYPWPSTVNVANFISTKLWFDETSTNYEIWKEQMLCLIEGQDLLGFIDGSILPPPPETQYHENYLFWRSDRLLKGWILGSLHEDIVYQVASLITARDVWLELENKFAQLTHLADQTATSENDPMEYVPLHKALLQGDWEATKTIFDKDPTAITATINYLSMTPLFVAVGTRKAIHIVQKLVEMMTDDAIAQKMSGNGNTALHVAAVVGNIGAATILVNRMPSLLYVSNFFNDFPLQMASRNAQKGMVHYLISVTKDQTAYDGVAGLRLLMSLIRAEFFDVALDLIKKYPYLAKLSYPNGNSALSIIAENMTIFGGGCRFGFWERFIPTRLSVLEKRRMMNQQAQSLAKCLCKQIESMSFTEASVISHKSIITAARVGNSDLVEMIIEAYPSAIYYTMPGTGRTINHVAVENRSENVFNLLCQMSDQTGYLLDTADNHGNNLLHVAGKLAPAHKLNQISGAALQLQRELQWYKEAENVARLDSKNRFNKEGKSPKTIFTEEHKQLKEQGEKWMKDTSASCTITAALIATVMFGAAITVPGGNESTTGFPMFSKDVEFIAFAICNAISLFTSTTSLLMFLSILTSRYAEEDFLHDLPKRLIIGLGTLFVSVTFMMVAFSVTIYLVFSRKKAWVLIPVAALACLPVTSFVLLQYPLLVDLISSTYGRGIFGKQSNRRLFSN